MQDLATIQRMNNAIESAKIRKRARALNSGGEGHAKDTEKGRKKFARLNVTHDS